MLPSLGWGVFWCFRARNRTGRPPAGGKKQSCGLFFSPREMDARVTKKLSLERGWAFSFVKNKYWNRGVWESKSPGPAGDSPRGAAVCQTETRGKPETAYRTNWPRGVGDPSPTGRKQKVNRQICWPNNGKMAVSVVYWNRKRQILKGTGGKFYENYFLWHAGV